MTDEKFVEYLVLGGLRHGEVWVGPLTNGSIELPSKADRRLAKFYSREAPAEITTPLDDAYFISEFSLSDGDKYMIASVEPLSSFDVVKEIKAITPPLKPVK